jgi:hypothetical protein
MHWRDEAVVSHRHGGRRAGPDQRRWLPERITSNRRAHHSTHAPTRGCTLDHRAGHPHPTATRSAHGPDRSQRSNSAPEAAEAGASTGHGHPPGRHLHGGVGDWRLDAQSTPEPRAVGDKSAHVATKGEVRRAATGGHPRAGKVVTRHGIQARAPPRGTIPLGPSGATSNESEEGHRTDQDANSFGHPLSHIHAPGRFALSAVWECLILSV